MKTPHALLLVGAALFWAGHARAVTNPEAKASWVQARDAAAASYKAARARCDTITGNPKDLCVAEAKAERVRLEQEAEASYRNTVQAYTRARLRIASANYDRDKTRCAALTGNAKDVCVEQAKATLVAAQANAKLDRKTIEARNEAREDKLTAEYRVALEKCDAYAGAAKDQCVGAAKNAYGTQAGAKLHP
jgi:uncharacterized protein YicC (UPF0701 family)